MNRPNKQKRTGSQASSKKKEENKVDEEEEDEEEYKDLVFDYEQTQAMVDMADDFLH